MPKAGSPSEYLEFGRRKLLRKVTVDVSSRSQAITVSAQERTPELARWLCGRLIFHTDGALRKARTADAQGRFRYLEDQANHYAAQLRLAEDSLWVFLAANRFVASSPRLILEQSRLQRSVDLSQATYVAIRTQRDMAGAEVSEAAPQIALYSSPTIPFRRSQIGRKFFRIELD